MLIKITLKVIMIMKVVMMMVVVMILRAVTISYFYFCNSIVC